MEKWKIAFIICGNNAQYVRECKRYITRLSVPKGFEIEIIVEENASSMTNGYNEAAKKTNAKYKVYLHQDLFILEKEFLQYVLDIFQEHQEIGMIGMVGGVELPKNGIIYSSWNCGNLYTCNGEVSFEIIGKIHSKNSFQKVEALDGCVLVTQYDIPWREDLFTEWDFYDVSQSMEYRKNGYEVVIPLQKKPWCLHDDGPRNLCYYEKNRKIFIDQYGEKVHGENIENRVEYDIELAKLTGEIKNGIKKMIESGETLQAALFLKDNYSKLNKDKELTILNNILGIILEEEAVRSTIQFGDCNKVEDLKEKYLKYKFLLYRMEYEQSNDNTEIDKAIMNGEISANALVQMMGHHCIQQKNVLERVADIYQKYEQTQIAEVMRKIITSLS